jgi:5'(3')-deoxyribonucleotidase
MKLAIDIDGVCRNMITPAINIYKRDFDPNSTVTYNTWEKWAVKDNLPKIKNDYQFFYKYAKELFLDAPIYPGTKEALMKLRKQGHYIAIVTHQLKNLEHYTAQWVNKHKLQYDSLHFTKDKAKVDIDFLVDDNPINLNRVFEKFRNPICFEQPWNSNYYGLKIKSLDELVEMFTPK